MTYNHKKKLKVKMKQLFKYNQVRSQKAFEFCFMLKFFLDGIPPIHYSITK